MKFKNFRDITVRLRLEALTDYKVDIGQTDGDLSGRYMISNKNLGTMLYTDDGVYQFKIICAYTNYLDCLRHLMAKGENFYIVNSGYLYKSVADLVLGNLLSFNGISFILDERFEGFIGEASDKFSIFCLSDHGVTVQVKASDRLNQISVSSRFAEDNPFIPYDDSLDIEIVEIDQGFTLEALIKLFHRHLGKRWIDIDVDSLDSSLLTAYEPAQPPKLSTELARMGLTSEVNHASR